MQRQPPALSGTVKPNAPLETAFNGQSLAGTWNLKAVDNAAQDSGTLQEWCLIPTTSGGTTHTIGGNVSGLTGTGLVLSLSGGAQALPIAVDGAFTFPAGLAGGTAYAVTVGTQPTAQTCAVANGNGTIGSSDVTDIAVTCSAIPAYTVGGSVSGLAGGGLMLSLNGGAQTLPAATNGSFAFPLGLSSGASYAVTVAAQPPGNECAVANGDGTIASADVTDVAVSCSNDVIFANGFESTVP